MRTRTVLLLALFIAVVSLAFGSHLASAQGSPTTPVGGGGLKPVTGFEGGFPSLLQTKVSWSWLDIRSRTFLPLTRTMSWSGRVPITATQANHGWASKLSR